MIQTVLVRVFSRVTLLSVFFSICFLGTLSLMGQDSGARFGDEIRNFKIQDSLHNPPRGAILFVGSSSFRIWKDVNQYFPGYTIINRGFGGSTLEDVLHYINQVVFAYEPRQIVVYCGENDLASSDSIQSSTVAGRFFQLFNLIRDKWPTMPVVFVSIKPSPSRASIMPKIEVANQMIREFIRTKSKADYVDVFHPMLNDAGQPRGELFISDNLHMNANGYKIWQKALQPVLLKEN